jgi:acetyl esterase/lipase
LRLRSFSPMTENPRSAVAAWFSGEAVRIQVAMARRSYLHRYGGHPEQVADLHLPDGRAPDGAVVLVHGGFWRERYRRDLMTPLAEDLAARGLAAWNVEYRRLDCGGGWPATLEDVRAAIARLHDIGHAPVAAVGHSAGGHLALLAADLVPAVVGQAAVTDLEEASRLRLGDGVADRFAPGALAEASPVRRAPLPARTLLVHGTADGTVPASMSQGFPGATVALRPGEGHFEHIDPASGAWEEAVTWIEQQP